MGETTGRAGAHVFVNDRADVALLAGARGIHLPADGLPTDRVRDLVGPDVWIGRSVHAPEEARRAAEAGADYVFLGPIWETPSHPGRPGLGPGIIEHAQPARVVAIGGVTPDRVASCLDAGAYGVAAVSALWTAGDPGSAAATMLLLLRHS
jgi:thiamine-phosphate pyrophosphorylase